MTDQVAQVSSAAPSNAQDPVDTDQTALAAAFQNALLQGSMFTMQNLQSDAIEAFSDSASDPDAPF